MDSATLAQLQQAVAQFQQGLNLLSIVLTNLMANAGAMTNPVTPPVTPPGYTPPMPYTPPVYTGTPGPTAGGSASGLLGQDNQGFKP
jgi:hypothetical protein